MSNLPDKIKIGDVYYQLKAWNDKEDHRCSDFIGRCDRINKIIHIDVSRQPTENMNTLIHEILHALYDFMNIKPGMEEEDLVTCMSNALNMLLLDNSVLLDVFKGYIGQSREENDKPKS